MTAPRNFPWPAPDPSKMRAGMQGQNFVTVMENSGPLSKVIIVMRSRKVSNVHAHENSDVYVDVQWAAPRGALTLAGFELEHEIWTPPGCTLHLPPGMPHVAVYPGPTSQLAAVHWPDLVALETRCNPVADADIIPLAGYGRRLVERLRQLDLLDLIDPSPEMLEHL